MGTNPDIKSALESLDKRRKRYTLHSDYYDGNHSLAFATEKWKSAFGELFKILAENLCPTVVDAVTDRLRLVGCSNAAAAPDGDAPADPVTAELARIWRLNRMDEKSGQVHREACKVGDCYVVVWPDADGTPRLHVNEAKAVTVEYDPENGDRVVKAAKFFEIPDGDAGRTRRRCNLYYPDRTEKYVASGPGSDFRPFDDGAGPVVPNPTGVVPVFHFRNNAPPGRFGKSELADVVGLQDALNKSVADLLVGGEYYALPRRYATGIELRIDPETGKPADWKPEIDTMLTATAPDARFGQFEPADLTKLVAVADMFRLSISRVSGTPVHLLNLLSGDFPSGESLKTAEARLTAKVDERRTSFGNAWEDVFRFALLLRGYRDADLDANWADVGLRDELSQANAVQIRRNVGISRRQALRDLNYTDAEIRRIERERAEEDAAARDAAARDANFTL